MLGREIEVGGIYKGVVTTVKEYGAFVEFNGGQQGLLHISELAHGQVCTFHYGQSHIGPRTLILVDMAPKLIIQAVVYRPSNFSFG